MAVLKPIDKPARHAAIDEWSAADMEWIPAAPGDRHGPGKPHQLRVIGAYSDSRGYRWYPTVKEWLDREVRSQALGLKPRRQYYLWHAGGRADSGFLIEELMRCNADARLQPNHGSLAYIEYLRSSFVDTLPILRGSLAEIGKKLGYEKLESPAWDGPLDDLVTYNERDNRLLYTACLRLEKTIRDLGGTWKRSLASMSMDLFRRKYQTREISCPRQIHDALHESYKASMVEIYHYGSPPVDDPVNQDDINSSFPTSMIAPLPCTYRGRTRGPLPPGRLGFARARVSVPRGTEYPFLPYRYEGTVYFPTGEWESWFFCEELEYAATLGVSIDIKEWLVFDTFTDLERFIRSLYALKVGAIGTYEEYVFKILMNANYGKWDESEDKEEFYLGKQPDGATPYGQGVYRKAVNIYCAHKQPQIASAITSRSRILLHRGIMRAIESGNRVYAVDTDCVTGTQAFPSSTELGEFKRENKEPVPADDCFFLAPKVYALGDKVKAKGFAGISRLMGRAHTAKSGAEKRELIDAAKREFDLLVSGSDHSWQGNTRLTVLLRGQSYSTEEYKRRVLGLSHKRCVFHDGATRPWSIEEIHAGDPYRPVQSPSWRKRG